MPTAIRISQALLLAVFFVAIAKPAWAARTGYELYHDCMIKPPFQTGADAADGLSCPAYVDGFLDGAEISARLTGRRVFCAASNPAIGEYVLVFERWAQQHPQYLTRPAADVLAAAFAEAFPCPAQ